MPEQSGLCSDVSLVDKKDAFRNRCAATVFQNFVLYKNSTWGSPEKTAQNIITYASSFFNVYSNKMSADHLPLNEQVPSPKV